MERDTAVEDFNMRPYGMHDPFTPASVILPDFLQKSLKDIQDYMFTLDGQIFTIFLLLGKADLPDKRVNAMCEKVDEAYVSCSVHGHPEPREFWEWSDFVPETIDKHLKEIKDLANSLVSVDLKRPKLTKYLTLMFSSSVTFICETIDTILPKLEIFRNLANKDSFNQDSLFREKRTNTEREQNTKRQMLNDMRTESRNQYFV